MLAVRPRPVHLPRPAAGEGVLVHDATFEAWDTSFSVMRDLVNLGVEALNHAGAGLPSLPHGSLRELLVLPLSGDYGAIRRNAVACRDVGAALRVWSGNVEVLVVGAAADWSGAAGAAYLLRMQRLAISGAGLAELATRGALVFEQVARQAERFGVRIEHLVVDLGHSLSRLVRKLLARVAGPAGWAAFAAELLVEGLSAVTDLIDDVRRVVRLVDELLALAETVRDWALETRDTLDFLLDLTGELV